LTLFILIVREVANLSAVPITMAKYINKLSDTTIYLSKTVLSDTRHYRPRIKKSSFISLTLKPDVEIEQQERTLVQSSSLTNSILLL
jgi:hypothetical protein